MIKKLISACLVLVMAFSMFACSPNTPPPEEPAEIPVTGVVLNESNLNLTVGESRQLVVTVQPINATNKNVIWHSSKTSVATVENGQVTAKGEGQALIYVTHEDGTYWASCNVNVVLASDPVNPEPDTPVDPEPDTPVDPDPETPVDPDPDTPVDPDPDTPVDPDPDTPVDPDPDIPVDPEPDTPVDPEPDTPVDPDPDTPVDPDPDTPVDPDPDTPVDPDPDTPVDPDPDIPVDPDPDTPVDPPVNPDEGGDLEGGDDNTEGEDQTLSEWRESILSNYKKFYTFSLDDGVTQDVRFIELLNKYGLKATFNINTGLLGRDTTADLGGAKNPSTNQNVTHTMVTAEQIASGLYNGHELASHTYSHPSLIRDAVDSFAIKNQIQPDVENIKAWTGKEPIGMAYPGPGGYRVWKCTNGACGRQLQMANMPSWCPYCGLGGTFNTSNTEVVLDFESGMNISATAIQHIKNNTNIKYGRTIENSYKFNLPKDFMIWNPTCSFKDELLLAYAESFRQLQVEDGDYKLFYVWGHTYEFDMADPTNPTQDDWARIEQFLAAMSYMQDAICLTNEEAYLLFADKIPSGTKKYATMSFDDGATYDEEIANTLNKYGLEATFFLNTGVLGQAITGVNGAIRLTEAQLVNAINNGFYKGHDMASHGYRHAPGGFAVGGVTQWSHADIIAEVHNDIAKIETITGKRPIGFAYPGGTTYTNEEVRNVFRYFTYAMFARGTLDTYQFGIPTDWMNWQPTCEVAADKSLTGGFDICALFDEYVNNDRTDDFEVFYMWDHSWAIVMYGKSQIFDNFCNAVDQARDKVACLTNTEFYKLFACNEV